MSEVKDIMLLCRLCSVKYDVNVPIFGEEDNILSKILACLPLKVSPEDKLPKKICETCSIKLECCYLFRTEAVNTEALLLNLLSQADELTLVSSSTTNQSKFDDVHIKAEIIDISENKISIPETQDTIETNCPEEKSNEQIKDEKPEDLDEPLPKRRKTSETLQAEEYEIHPDNLDLMLTSTLDITEKTKTEEDNPETSDVASDNDARCTAIAQEDVGNEPDHIDSTEVQGDPKLKDCVVILGDLEGVDVKKYQFFKQTTGESKSSTCTLKCSPCGRNFGNAVSSYIDHLITEHSKDKDDGFTSDVDPLSKKITVVCKYCDETFEGEDSLKNHMTVVHPYVCSRCNRVFMNVHQSLLHTKMHFILDKRKPAEYKKYLKMKSLSTDAAVNSDDVVGEGKIKEVIEQKKKELIQKKKKLNQQIRKEVANEQKKKEVTNEQKKKEVANEQKKKEVANEQKKKEVANEQKKKEVANEQKKKEEAKPQPTCSTSNQKTLQQIAAKNVNEPQKNYNCVECKSWFEDCYQLQRHRVAMHRKKPEKRYESIKLYKCVLCAKHYPSKQMLDDHKATHLIDVRTAVEEIAKPKSLKKHKPVVPNIKITESKTTDEERASLDKDDVIVIDNDENKKPNLDESTDILDNVEIICNDIEFDNEDTIDAGNESQTQYPPSDTAKTLPSQTVEAQNFPQNSFTRTTEAPLQTQNTFPQINLLQPPPLMISNINKGLGKFVQLMPGNCSIITMPCASNLPKNTNITAVPNFTNNQNVLNNANDSKQINAISVDKLQPCVSLPSNLIQGNAPIVLNTFLKQNIDQTFNLQANEPASKFRKIKPKLQPANADKSDPSTSRKAKDDVITVIIERETKVQETKDNGTSKKNEQIKIVVRNNAEKSADREESNLAQAKNSEESNSKLTEATNPNKSSSCIKIDSSDSSGADSDGKGGHSDDNSSSEAQSRDVIEINSSSDESKNEKSAKSAGAQQPLCAICNRRHYARYITMKYLIYICTWCNYTVSVVMKKIELFNKLKSPLATGVLTAVGSIEHSESRLQCNICKLIQKGTEFTSAGSLVVCNLCKLKTASVTAILMSIKERGRFNGNKHTNQNKFCKATCEACGTVVKIQTVTYLNQIVICNACRPKLFEIAAVSSSMRCKTDNNFADNTLEDLLLQTRCFVCKDMKKVGEIFLLSDKSICVDCKYNIAKFAEFLHNLQKSRRCLNCKKFRKGLRLKELSTYCSRCFPFRPNACSECEKSGTFGQCSCKKRAENENSDDEGKLIIDLESENVAKDMSEGQKQKDKKSIRRESNASSSSSIEVVEESALEENSVPQGNSEDMPSTSNAEIVPKIFLKPMCSLLEPRSKILPLIRKINCGICSNKIETLEESNICSGIVTCLKCKLKMDNLDPKTNNFTCFYCSEECGNKDALAAHKDTVHLCPICKKHREHVYEHLKNVIKCQKCEQIFCKKFSLSDHYRQKHDCRWCVVCDTVLRDDYEVLLHRTLVHNQV